MATRVTVVVLLVLAVALSGGLGGGFRSAEAAQRGRAAPDALDLAAATLIPDDAGEPGYGISTSGHRSLLEFADLLNQMQGGGDADLADITEALDDAGWRQSYFSRISVPTDDDPDFFRRTIYAALIEFEDADGAEEGLTVLTEANAAVGYEAINNAPDIGDQSVVTRNQGTASDGNTRYQELDVVFQFENVVAEIDLIDFTNDAPPTRDISDLAEVMIERIEAVQAGEAPGLSIRVLRLEGTGVTSGWDYYGRRDGEQFPDYNQSEDSVQSDDEYYSDIGATDVYWAQQNIPIEDEDEPTSYNLTIERFEDEDAAATWLADFPPAFVESPNAPYSDVEVVDDAEQVGDESTTLAYSFDRNSGATSSGYLVYLRVEDTIAIVGIDGVVDTPLAVVEELAAAQADCLGEDACLERLPVPDELGGAGPESGPEDEPTEEPEDEPTEEPEDEPTEEPGNGGDDEALEIDLDEVDRSGVEGAATLTAAGTRTRVEIELDGAEEGQVAVIQEGTCDDLAPEAAFDLREIDEDGASSTTVRIGLEDLLADEHAIAIYESADDLDAPLACGDITD